MPESKPIVFEPLPKVSAPQFADGFGPSNGGDIIIVSNDGINFMVYSALLRSVSPILSDMINHGEFQVDLSCPKVRLPHHSDAIAAIFRLLVQHPTQIIVTSFAMLSACLHASTMYRLHSVTAHLRSLLWVPGTVLYLPNSPIDAYNLSTVYGFVPEKEAAFQYCIRAMEPRDINSINFVASRCWNIGAALSLVSRLAWRSTVILDTLSMFHAFPMNLRAQHWNKIRGSWLGDEELVCNACRSELLFEPVSWQVSWAYFAKRELLKDSGFRCDHVFHVQFLCMKRDYDPGLGGEDIGNVEKVCRDCMSRILLDSVDVWEAWASEVKRVLIQRLGDAF